MKRVLSTFGRSATLFGIAFTALVSVANADTVTLRLGTVLAPNDPMGQGLDRLSQRVAERTDGAVKIDVFHNSQLGDTRDIDITIRCDRDTVYSQIYAGEPLDMVS